MEKDARESDREEYLEFQRFQRVLRASNSNMAEFFIFSLFFLKVNSDMHGSDGGS